MNLIWQTLLHNLTFDTENTLAKLIAEPLVFPLIDYGFILINGIDVEKYLQGQLTCDIAEITENCSHLTAICNPQGQVQSIFRLFKVNENYYLRVPLYLLDNTLQRLKKYAVFSKLTIENVSDKWLAIGFAGKNIEEFLQEKFTQLPKNSDEIIKSSQGVIVKIPGAINRYEFYSDAINGEKLWHYYLKQLTTATVEYWHLLEIIAGIPNIYPQTTEMFTPHHLNLPQLNAVSFKKGCYTGQEVIARIEYRSTNKPKLHHFTLASAQPPVFGAEIYKQHQVVGTIVDFAKENESSYHLLATLKEQELDGQSFYLDKENMILLHSFLTTSGS